MKVAEIEDRIGLIDLDGTVADYDTPMKHWQNVLASPGEPKYEHRPRLDADELPHIVRRRKLIQRLPGFWRSFKEIPLGFEIVEEMRKLGFVLHVLTKGPKDAPNAWSEKVEWCQAHLPDAMVHVGSDKSLVFGRVLVDDWPEYFDKWLLVRPRGLVICVAHPWNEEYAESGPKAHPNVLRYDGSNRVQLVARLFHAYMRNSGESTPT